MLAITALVFTSCSDDDDDKTGRKPIAMSKEVKEIIGRLPDLKALDVVKLDAYLAGSSKGDFNAWKTNLEGLEKRTTQAIKGHAGTLPRKGKDLYFDDKGIEVKQVIAKGLIGAYQVENYKNHLLQAYRLKDADKREEQLNRGLAYLLGDYTKKKTKDEYNGEGNSFAKYMVSVGLQDKIFKAIEDTKKVIDTETFNAELLKLNGLINKVLALKTKEYLVEYPTNVRTAKKVTVDDLHEMSEGYGFAYSLQFVFVHPPAKTISKADAEKITGFDLWTLSGLEAESELEKEAKKAVALFGVQ